MSNEKIKYSGSNTLTYLLNLLNTKFGTKVDKVDGKGLSTNDYDNTEKAKVAASYTHSQSAHAPSNAEKNVIVEIQKNSVAITPDANRKVNIEVPTKTSELTNDKKFITIEDVPEGAVPSTTTPKMNAATAVIGTEKAFSRGDHVHPSDNTKVDKVTGKQLSTNDYTTDEKNKLAGIEANANKYTHPTDGGSGFTSNMYKVTVNAAGHVTAATAVTKTDITDLGIPGYMPTVPTISTSILDDAASDTKTASPKAVKTYVDTKVSATYKPAGSVTFANLPPVSSSGILGNVYNVTDAFITTADFVEGAGKSHPAGSNVAVVLVSGAQKFDVLSGFIDLSPYAKTADFEELSNAEVQEIWDSIFTS